MKNIQIVISILLLLSGIAFGQMQPEGGNSIPSSTPIELTWNSSLTPSPVMIELINCSSFNHEIISHYCANNSLEYIFSDKLENNLLRIKVTSINDKTKSQMTNSYFTIRKKQPNDSNNQIALDNILQVIPNITNFNYKIICKNEISTLELYNISNELLYSQKNINQYSINTPFHFTENGLYIAKVIDKFGNTFFNKLIINL